MNKDAVISRNELTANMIEGRPLKSYKKVILGKILLKLWDSLLNAEKELVFEGDPRKGDETVFDVYTEQERVYFERMNRRHFQTGSLVNYTRPEVAQETEKTFEQYSDDEIKAVIDSGSKRFISLQHTLNSIDSIAVLFRMRYLAEEMEKSDRITKAIEARISEVQANEFAPKRAEASPIEE